MSLKSGPSRLIVYEKYARFCACRTLALARMGRSADR